MTISVIGTQMLQMQTQLAEDYKYKPIPPLIAELNMQQYIENLPSEFRTEVNHIYIGYELKGQNIPLFSKEGTQIAKRFDRIVIGHYGAFIEIAQKDMCMYNIICEKGQEYRITDPKYSENVKYQWYTTKDDSHCKLYLQQKTVEYADYIPHKWYISPYEVLDQEEIRILQGD